MKTKILFIVFFGLLNSLSFSQVADKTNYISGTIEAPIIVDQITTEDHFLDDRRDSNTKDDNVRFHIYTQLKFIPIRFVYKRSFVGYYMEEVYDRIIITRISGAINPETNLGVISINQTETKNVKSDGFNVCDYDYEYSYNYQYKNLKIIKGAAFGNQKDNKVSYLFKPSENTKLTVRNFKSIEDTKCPKRNYSKEFTYKNINEEFLKRKLVQNFPYFTFTVYWDGKTEDDLIKESITVTEVRGEDPNWEPSLTRHLRDGIESEPNSIGVYYYEATITNATNAKIKKKWEDNNLGKGMAALLIADLSKVKGLKVLERMKLDKIVQEIELSESGLVKENSKVENKLMKEEIAVKIELEIDERERLMKAKCNVISKNKEILITTNFLPLENLFHIQEEIAKEIMKEANKQFNMNIDPEKIFMQ